MCVCVRAMSGGMLGVAGDILSVAFLCFLCSLAVQLYCAFSRRNTRLPPAPLPAFISSPPPSAASKQLYLLRFQRSASYPVVSAIAPPPSPPNKLSSAYHVTCSISDSPSNVFPHGPLPSAVASQACTADLAKLMQLESGQEQEVDAENQMSVPPPRGLLFTIREEGKDEEATEQSNVASDTSREGSSIETAGAELSVEQVLVKGAEPFAKYTCGHAAAACLHSPGAAGLLSQVSSASSEGGVSMWWSSGSTPCPSSPALSFLSASSSPFPIHSSPPRSSCWAPASRFSTASN